MMAHPTYDGFWKARSPLQYLKNVKPATMVVGGWYDHEDLWGTLAVYHAIETQNPGARNTLVIGPGITDSGGSSRGPAG
jgi:predicted acyl esterase